MTLTPESTMPYNPLSPLSVLASALAALLLAAPAQAQTYPNKPVHIVVPSAAGGGTDIVTRVLAQQLSIAMGQQFIVENRPGAGQMIGIEAVARAAPDGYTLLMAASTLAINPVMFKKVTYDAVKDFAPVTQVAVLPNVLLVHPSVPAKTVAEFVALAKSKPDQIAYGSAGVGTSPHMGMELFRSMAGINLRHIPYRGTAPAVNDLVGGQVSAMMANVLTAKPLVEGGQLRALGVSGSKRSTGMPNVPIIAEAGVPGYLALNWYGLLAPAGTPNDIVMKVQAAVAKALELPDVKERLAADGAEGVGSTPAEFAAVIKEEIDKWAKVAKEAKIEPQ
jgi:tripartite-type tricarboxylate transporter receptor subunit TctC